MKNISTDIRDMFRSPALYVCIAVTVYVLLLSIKEYLFTGLATEVNFSALELITDMFASSGCDMSAAIQHNFLRRVQKLCCPLRDNAYKSMRICSWQDSLGLSVRCGGDDGCNFGCVCGGFCDWQS